MACEASRFFVFGGNTLSHSVFAVIPTSGWEWGFHGLLEALAQRGVDLMLL